MPFLGFENTYVILIRREDAEKLKITNVSEAAQYSPQLRGGFGHEFMDREDGYRGLVKTYNLKFSEPPLAMDLNLIYRALADKKVDLISGDSTHALISVYDLFMLEDDKQYFPPYQAVPVFNKQTLRKYPQVKEAIARLTGKISVEEMREMNYKVANQSLPVKEVVENFLSSEGLL